MSLHLRIADGGAGHDDLLSVLTDTDDLLAWPDGALRPRLSVASEFALQFAYGDDFDVDDEDDYDDDEFESEFEDDYDEEDLDDLEDVEDLDYDDDLDDIDDDY